MEVLAIEHSDTHCFTYVLVLHIIATVIPLDVVKMSFAQLARALN